MSLRVGCVLTTALAFCFLGCSTATAPVTANLDVSPLNPVYTTVLRSLGIGAVVQRELATDWPADYDHRAAHGLGLPVELLVELRLVTATARPVVAADLPLGVEAVPAHRIGELFAGGREPGWQAFEGAFPGVNGIVRLSGVLPLPSSHRVLVYASHSLGCLNGEGRFYILKRAKSGWRIVRSISAWVS
jgi:hypothetical protein